ncbi:12760_t:CDS:2, partial [Ambispora gerdemannii]
MTAVDECWNQSRELTRERATKPETPSTRVVSRLAKKPMKEIA